MKNIAGVGFEIPSEDDDYIRFDDTTSLSDHDIIIFSPNMEDTYYNYDHDDYEGKSLYNKSSSSRIIDQTKHWHKELNSFLKSGKTLFVILKEKRDFFIYSGEKSFSGTGKSQRTTFHVRPHSNYSFIPFNLKVSNASGKLINVENSVFTPFFNDFKEFINYEAYIEQEGLNPLFSTRNKDKVLGAYSNVENGLIIYLPHLDFNSDSLTKNNEEFEEEWNSKGLQVGKRFIQSLIKIEKSLRKEEEKTPKPTWVENKSFALKQAEKTKKQINNNNEKIKILEKSNQKLQKELEEQESLKDLLYETGKPLEQAVIKALKILGFEAENYDDGTLELDQVIIGPENIRYIGECEGKDKKDIDIGKFRQLLDALSEDFEREEIEEKAFGLLFGNPKRFTEPDKRGSGFTTKCITGAEREKIGLIKTSSLFDACRRIIEQKDDGYKLKCRNAIFEQLGGLIEFPKK
ncbi:hypothetical protein [Reichenbachiella sp.]|uniref:hypothetical protein n=1 Tax=Reichenbachiella sp. TaxID=2184521 RepID=UPI003B5BF6EE